MFRSLILHAVDLSLRLPRLARPLYWGGYLGLAVGLATLAGWIPLWLLRQKADIPELAVVIVLVSALGGVISGLIFAALGPLARAGRTGVYALWMISGGAGGIGVLALLRWFDRGSELGLQRPLSPWIALAGGGLIGLILARAREASRQVGDDDLSRISLVVAEALRAEATALEQRAAGDPSAAAALARIRQGEPSAEYVALLERAAARLARADADDPATAGAQSHVARLLERAREDVRRLAEDPSYAQEIQRRSDAVQAIFLRELEREAKRLRRRSAHDPAAAEELRAIESQLADARRRGH